MPLPQVAPNKMPLWLVLPEGWRQQGVLAHTASALTQLRANASDGHR